MWHAHGWLKPTVKPTDAACIVVARVESVEVASAEGGAIGGLHLPTGQYWSNIYACIDEEETELFLKVIGWHNCGGFVVSVVEFGWS